MKDNLLSLGDHKAKKDRKKSRAAERENTKIIWPEDVTKEQIQAAHNLIDNILEK